MRKSAMLVLIVFFISVSAGIADDYPCPYSGPATEDELFIDAHNYVIDLQIVYPEGEIPGYITGITTVEFQVLGQDLSEFRLDFFNTAQLTIDSVRLNGDECPYRADPDEIVFQPEVSLTAGSQWFASITYTGESLIRFQFRPKDDARYAFNRMVENSRWFPCQHDPRDKAEYTFHIRVPSGKTAACNGNLIDTHDNGDGTVTYTWIESDPMASYLATVNIADYVIFGHTFRDIPIIYYVVPESQADAAFDFQNDDEILDFYISAFGPYPFDKLGLAQVPLGGAMENQDMISYGDALITGDRRYEDVFAHEISHMWWGNSVTLTGCYDVWLNEGFASYCEALWEEHLNGFEAYQEVMDHHRTEYFQEDANHRYSIYDPEVVWSATTYEKAAWVLHMLRWVLGEEKFWAVLPDYYSRYAYGNATTADFQKVCEDHYAESLDWFFQEWIYDKGYPEFHVSYEYLEDLAVLRLIIEQKQENAPDVFIMPIPFELTYRDDTSERMTINLDTRKEILRMDAINPLKSVALDPDSRVLGTIAYESLAPSTGVIMAMPSHTFRAGDPCWLRVLVRNAENADLTGYPVFVILEAFENYYFAPSFSNDYDSYLSRFPVIPRGDTLITVIDSFEWPSGIEPASGLIWYAAMTDPAVSGLFGDMDVWTFGWE